MDSASASTTGDTRARGWISPDSSLKRCSALRDHLAASGKSVTVPSGSGRPAATASNPDNTPAAEEVTWRIRLSRPQSGLSPLASGTARRRGQDLASTRSATSRLRASAWASATTGSRSNVTSRLMRPASPSTSTASSNARMTRASFAERVRPERATSEMRQARRSFRSSASRAWRWADRSPPDHQSSTTPPPTGRPAGSTLVPRAPSRTHSMSTYSRMTPSSQTAGWSHPMRRRASAPPMRAGITASAKWTSSESCQGAGDTGRTDRTVRWGWWAGRTISPSSSCTWVRGGSSPRHALTTACVHDGQPSLGEGAPDSMPAS